MKLFRGATEPFLPIIVLKWLQAIELQGLQVEELHRTSTSTDVLMDTSDSEGNAMINIREDFMSNATWALSAAK